MNPPMSTHQRLLSLDVLRGITVAGMILVNNAGACGYGYAPLRHAKWDGFTPADLVFPMFMFVMATYNRKNNKTCFSFNSDRHCDEMAHPFLRNGNLERLGAHAHLRSDATARHLLRDHCRHGIIHPTQTFSSDSPALANRLFYPSTGRKRIREKSR